jgi:hypothetical protein
LIEREGGSLPPFTLPLLLCHPTAFRSFLTVSEEASALRRLLLFSKAANGFGEKDLRSNPRVPAGKAGEDTLSARRVFFPTYMPPEKMI